VRLLADLLNKEAENEKSTRCKDAGLTAADPGRGMRRKDRLLRTPTHVFRFAML